MTEATRDSLLIRWPDGLLMKARAATEGDDRFVYIEPSNENWDIQNERVLQKGLAADAEDFLRWGNLDIGHFTLPGMAKAATAYGYEHPRLAEIGKPVEVKLDPVVMVKGRLYRGDSEIAAAANYFWKSLTDPGVAKEWYPSIGGRPGPKVCDATGCTLMFPTWRNIGFWNEPVNQTVKAVSAIPFGAFAKALTSGSYETDASSFEGGRALQGESLSGSRYQNDELAYLLNIRRGDGCEHSKPPFSEGMIVDHFTTCTGYDGETAKAAATRLISNWHHIMQQRNDSPAREAA